MSKSTKDQAAEWLAHQHYAVDSGVMRIFRLVKEDGYEADPNEPIKLLEVYEYTIPSGIVPVHFPPDPPSGLDYATEIVQIAPEELNRLQANDLQLPKGWSIGQEYSKSAQIKDEGNGPTE